jgi:hypothetical protein
MVYSDDNTLTEDDALYQWARDITKAFRDNGTEACPGKYLEGWVKDAGFTNVHHEIIKIPVGPWPKNKQIVSFCISSYRNRRIARLTLDKNEKKEIGLMNLIQLLEGLEGFSLRIYTGFLKWQVEEVQVLLAKVRQNLKRKDIHALFDL